jgi:protein Tex
MEENKQDSMGLTDEELSESSAAEESDGAEGAKPGDGRKDVKPKTPFEHWLKRRFPGHSLKGMLFAYEQFEAGVSVPYLAFYRSDETDGMRTANLYALLGAKDEWLEIERKQKHLLQEIQVQQKLTPELQLAVERSTDLDRLEDIYVPFKLKRQSMASQARDAGLGALAQELWDGAHGGAAVSGLADKMAALAKPDSKFVDGESVAKGVTDILTEKIAETFELRSLVRSTVLRRSKLISAKGTKAKAQSKYSKFFAYQEPIGSLKKASSCHRYLQMRRGWMEDELVLSFERPDEGVLLERFEEFACPNREIEGADLLLQAARLALKGNVYTVMENEAHRHLKEAAEEHLLEQFCETYRKKLLRTGLGPKPVVGIDPGGADQPCSLALLDAGGKPFLQLTMKLEELNDSIKAEFLQSLEQLKIEAIAVAHGPKSKEVRDRFRSLLDEGGRTIPIVVVHEHTAGVYAGSPLAKEEFPHLEQSARRAVFVGRFLQDPLSALIRIDPKFISLGELQHELSQGKLRAALGNILESAVNFVGPDVNSASRYVLAKVSGLNESSATAIIEHREKNGPFSSREQLFSLPALKERSKKIGGFLRVSGAAEPLDRTLIHPDHYEVVKKALAKVAPDWNGVDRLPAEKVEALSKEQELSDALGARLLQRVLGELEYFGSDSRGNFEFFRYDPSLKTLADLKKGERYLGIVTNVTSFGAFVDVGIEQDGLVHISELTDLFAKNPFDSLFTGDVVEVWVGAVNEEKKQISLTMKNPAAQGQRERRPRQNRDGGQRFARTRRAHNPAGALPEGAAAQPGGAPPQSGGERRPRFRRPDDRRRPTDPSASPVEGQGKGNATPEGGAPFSRGPRRDGPRPERKEPRKAKKPMRDPKTGAIVKLDEEDGRVRGMKLPTRTKPVTFNPFAGLAGLLKDKEKPDRVE